MFGDGRAQIHNRSIVFPKRFGYDSAGKQGGAFMPHVVTKSDLVQVAAKAGNVSKAAAGEAGNAVFDAIVPNVAKGQRVTRPSPTTAASRAAPAGARASRRTRSSR